MQTSVAFGKQAGLEAIFILRSGFSEEILQTVEVWTLLSIL